MIILVEKLEKEKIQPHTGCRDQCHKIRIENVSLKRQVETLRKDNEKITKTYKEKLQKYMHKNTHQQRLASNRACKCKQTKENGYTAEEKDMMIADYESLLTTLEEEHLKLQKSSPNYKVLANEKDHSSAEILQIMLQFLSEKAKAKDEFREQRKRCLSALPMIGEGLITFRPKKNLNSSNYGDEEFRSQVRGDTLDEPEEKFTLNIKVPSSSDDNDSLR